MKKNILSVAALLFAGFAIAQTYVPNPIVAPLQQINPNAAAASGSNYSNINQAGVGSDATVQQQGTANASFIDQVGTSATVRNSVDVLQWGNVQPSISGHLNYLDASQNGQGNALSARQQGDLNEIFSTQVGELNTATVQQGANGAQQAESNLSLIDQDGRSNEANVEQFFDNNNASIIQRNNVTTGVGNRAYQSQSADPNQSAGHTARATQYGNDNETRQFQDGGSSAGAGNYAEANQGDATTNATRAFSQQLQSGELNESYSDQYGTDDTSYQEQSGTGNYAIARQNTNPSTSGGDNYSEQYQSGTNNAAGTEQNGRNNLSWQQQTGTSNVALTLQRHGQDGGNSSLVMQNGTGNASLVNQRAHLNSAIVDQLGNGHLSIINQNAGDAFPAIGLGSNTATVTQRNANVSLAPQAQRAAATVRSF